MDEDLKSKYRIIFDPKDAEKWCVELTAPEWSGIIYSYGSFHMKEPSHEGQSAICVYGRDIIHVPDRFKGVTFLDHQGTEFKNLLGAILIDIVNDHLKGLTEKDGRLVLEITNDQ